MKKEQALKIITANHSVFEYGETISEQSFRELFDITVTSDMEFAEITKHLSKAQIKEHISKEILAELSVSGVVKDILHAQGKHLMKSGLVYRVALPSENELIASRYRTKASRAIAKAKKLTDNTPIIPDGGKQTSTSLNYMMGGKIERYY